MDSEDKESQLILKMVTIDKIKSDFNDFGFSTVSEDE